MRRNWQKVLFIGSVLMMVLSLMVPCQPAWAAEKKDDKAVLDEVLDIMKEKGQISEEKYQELKARAKEEGAGKILAGFDGLTPYIKSADGQHKLEFHGFVQTDFRAFEEGTRNLNGTDLTNNFRVRRGRIRLDGTLYKYLDYRVEADFGQSTAILTDAYVELRYWPEFKVRGGQFKIPFSFEELTADIYIDFVERSIMNNMVPSRDVGVMLHGVLLDGMVEYAAGIFNGAGQNTEETNDSKDFAGRLLVRPFKSLNIPLLRQFHLAGHITQGDQDSGLSLRGRTDSTTFTFFNRVPTRGDRLRYGVEAVYAYGPFGLYGEFIQSEEERKGLGAGGKDLDDVTGRGWYVAASYLVTGEEKVHGKAPKVKPANPRTGDFGALELAARYAQLEFSSDSPLPAPLPAGNKLDALTLGVNWYLSPNVRLMFNWVQNWFDDVRGTPFTASPDLSKRGDKSAWELLSRLQIWF